MASRSVALATKHLYNSPILSFGVCKAIQSSHLLFTAFNLHTNLFQPPFLSLPLFWGIFRV